MRFIARSLLVLLCLYGLLFAVGDAFLADVAAPLWVAAVFAVGIVALQFLIAPYFISWILDIVWDEGMTRLPDESRTFLQTLCAERGLRMPRFGVILSGTPNAFAFGHVPGNARVVVTTGLIEVLTPDELNAVLAHEVGHVEHWDFAVMAVASLVPLLLYQVYAFARHNNQTRAAAYGAYLAYLLSQFIVLLLNRTREHYADQYSAVVTRAPNTLSSALVKIACGLVAREGEHQRVMSKGSKERKSQERREQRLAGTMALMGISHIRAGAALVLGGDDPAAAARIMRWDLVNPWARLYQLSSTHPLTALRVRELNREAASQHQAPRYPLAHDAIVRWGAFPVEVLLWAAPFVSIVGLGVWWTLDHEQHLLGVTMTPAIASGLLIFTGVAWMIRVLYRYRGRFESSTVSQLLEDLDVSEMRPRAVRLEGEVLGRGVPGAFWSPDLVIRDSTGIMYTLYRQSIPFARFLFAVVAADDWIGKRVSVEGWFRRGLRPYVEMSTIRSSDGSSHHAISRWIQLAAAAVCVAAGLWWRSHFST